MPVAAEDAVVVEGPAEEEHPSAGEGRLNIWLFRLDSEPASVPLDEAPGLVRDDANFVWVSLTGYAEADLREVARLLNLDSEAVRGTLSSWRRPHVRLYPGHAYVSVTVAQLAAETRRVEARQLDLFVGRNFLVSAHKLPLPFSGALESRAQHSPDLVRLDSGFMLFMVLDELLGYLEGLTEHLGDEIEAMEQRALRDAPDDFLEDLLQLKRYVFAIMRLTEQHRQVFTAFLRPDWQFDAEDQVRPYYQDLQGRLERLLDTMAGARESVNGAFDIYVSQMAHRTNQIVKILTMVSTVLLPSTVIVGIFGTSFQGLPIYRPAGFAIMLSSIALVSALIVFAFHRRRWL